MRLRVLLTIILATTGCAHRSSVASNVRVSPTVDLNSASDSELLRHLGENVTMHGQFSLRGKVGPFILSGSRPIYLVPQGNFSWGKDYERMEGHDVRVTGILRFAHYAPAPTNEGTSPRAQPEDHFYFDAETAKIEFNGS